MIFRLASRLRCSKRRLALHPILAISCLSASIIAIDQVSAQAIAAPTGVAASAGETQALLVWNTVTGATGYNVYRSTTSGYVKVNTTDPVAANAYIDSSLTNGTAYYYVVTALSGATESANSTQVSASPLVQDTYWTVTQPSTINAPAPTITSDATGISCSSGSTLMTSALVAGSTANSISAAANYSGTWTFTWTGTSWPSLYVISENLSAMYSASVNSGNGTASVSLTGGSTLISAAFPTSATEITTTPSTNVTFNTSDLTAPVFTTASTSHVAGNTPPNGSTSGTSIGWSETLSNNTSKTTAYTQAWFQSHFASPSSVVLTFTLPAQDITTSAALTSTSSTANVSAAATVSDIYSGL